RRAHGCGRGRSEGEVRGLDPLVHGGNEARPRGPQGDRTDPGEDARRVPGQERIGGEGSPSPSDRDYFPLGAGGFGVFPPFRWLNFPDSRVITPCSIAVPPPFRDSMARVFSAIASSTRRPSL